MSRINVTLGDTDPWTMTLKTSTGVVDLSTANVNELAMFMWSARDRLSKKINGSTMAAGSTIGVVVFNPTSTQVDTVDEYFQQVRLTRANGDVASFPSGDDYNRVSVSLGPPST